MADEVTDQQQALEADTVSRAEHEAAKLELETLRRCTMLDAQQFQAKLTALQAELDTWVQLVNRIHQAAHTTALNDGLPARVEELFQATEELSAQLATERARAEGAERHLAESDRTREKTVDLLAAANARAARLEEALRELAISVVTSRKWPKHELEQAWAALSTAPQASAGQAPSPAVGECDFDSGGFTPEMAMLAGIAAQPAPGWLTEGLCEAANASPEMKAHVAAHPSGYLPAQPAPGWLTERGPCHKTDDAGFCVHCQSFELRGPCRAEPDPTPAEPPPVDYVTYEVLIEALRPIAQWGERVGVERAISYLEKARGR